MRKLAAMALVVGVLSAGAADEVAAQQDFLAVGAEAPEVTLTGATREGVMDEPVHLSDFRGKTVVLAFFFRARTPG
jgi:hypothetical protein